MGDDFKFPLAAENITIDREENVYCGLMFFSRIQVYNKNGKFIRSWFVGSGEGGFNLNINEDDNLQVFATRKRQLFTYNLNGQI